MRGLRRDDEADLFWDDLFGARRPRRAARAAEPPPARAAEETGPGLLFDRLVGAAARGGGLMVEDVGAAGEGWEAIALPHAVTPPSALRHGDVVVRRALGEGRLATTGVLGEDVEETALYGLHGRIRPDVLVLRRRAAIALPSEDWPPAGAEATPTRAELFPPRDASSPKGHAFMQTIMEPNKGESAPARWNDREDAIVSQLVAGNMPDRLLAWIDVNLSVTTKAGAITGTVRVLPDYLAVGDDDDYVYVPLDPVSAQRVADAFGAVLPTARICHAIYKQADPKHQIVAVPRDYYLDSKLRKTGKPGRAQSSSAAYLEHSDTMQAKMAAAGIRLGELVAGYKKDVVISQRLHGGPVSMPGKVPLNRIAFHGFYDDHGFPREPCYENGKGRPDPSCPVDCPAVAHDQRFSDYSQGVRLVHPMMVANGKSMKVADVLADPELSQLISCDGPIVPPRIPVLPGKTSAAKPTAVKPPAAPMPPKAGEEEDDDPTVEPIPYKLQDGKKAHVARLERSGDTATLVFEDLMGATQRAAILSIADGTVGQAPAGYRVAVKPPTNVAIVSYILLYACGQWKKTYGTEIVWELGGKRYLAKYAVHQDRRGEARPYPHPGIDLYEAVPAP
jgi:hypothetical protein